MENIFQWKKSILEKGWKKAIIETLQNVSGHLLGFRTYCILNSEESKSEKVTAPRSTWLLHNLQFVGPTPAPKQPQVYGITCCCIGLF